MNDFIPYRMSVVSPELESLPQPFRLEVESYYADNR
jgi:hypothetical protein